MQHSNDRTSCDYNSGPSTTSESEVTIKRQPQSFPYEKEKYTSGKPQRIIIRAKITHD